MRALSWEKLTCARKKNVIVWNGTAHSVRKPMKKKTNATKQITCVPNPFAFRCEIERGID